MDAIAATEVQVSCAASGHASRRGQSSDGTSLNFSLGVTVSLTGCAVPCSVSSKGESNGRTKDKRWLLEDG